MTATDLAPPATDVGLRLLADAAALVAADSDIDRLVPAVLERVRLALGAGAVALWSGDESSQAPRWSVGAVEALAGVDAVTVRRALDGEASDAATAVLPLRAGGATLGALVVRWAEATPAVARGNAALHAVADLLASALANRARAERLTGELAARAGEVDAQRRFIERVIDSLPLGVYVIDRDYHIQLWNRKRETGMQGVAREEATGRSIFDVLHRQDAALMRREFDEVFSTGQMQQIQTESRSTGEARTHRLTKIPMTVRDGEVTHVITVGEDITEWKGALERTAQAEKLAALGQLAAGVMHEINNPLSTIGACAETMTLTIDELPRDRPAPPGFAEYLRIIDHEVHRCRRITEGLLNFSRAKPVQRARMGLNALVEQTLFLLKHHSRFKHCPVRLDLQDEPGPQVTCDPDQITQVAMAMLLNASDAVAGVAPGPDDEAAGVTVRTREVGGEAVLEIVDDGPGIAREDLTKIFEPFYTTKAPGEGTGLGLAICYGIVRDHGGRIEVDSAPGQGATFRVVLPAA